jgi:hypothetical protein
MALDVILNWQFYFYEKEKPALVNRERQSKTGFSLAGLLYQPVRHLAPLLCSVT